MSTDLPPPRRRHFMRWLLVLVVALFAWSGWRAYAFRSALAQAEVLGWKVRITDPLKAIQANWKAAFKKETWPDGVAEVVIMTSEEFEQHVALLDPRLLRPVARSPWPQSPPPAPPTATRRTRSALPLAPAPGPR